MASFANPNFPLQYQLRFWGREPYRPSSSHMRLHWKTRPAICIRAANAFSCRRFTAHLLNFFEEICKPEFAVSRGEREIRLVKAPDFWSADISHAIGFARI